MWCRYPKQGMRLASAHPMTLQEENLIRGTPEIGCRHTTPSPGLRPCWSGFAGESGSGPGRGVPDRTGDDPVKLRVGAEALDVSPCWRGGRRVAVPRVAPSGCYAPIDPAGAGNSSAAAPTCLVRSI